VCILAIQHVSEYLVAKDVVGQRALDETRFRAQAGVVRIVREQEQHLKDDKYALGRQRQRTRQNVYLGRADIDVAVDEIMPNFDAGQLTVLDDAALHLDLLQTAHTHERSR
jgi:hypothetical protein